MQVEVIGDLNVLSLTEMMYRYSREMKISISVLDLNVIKITTTAT